MKIIYTSPTGDHEIFVVDSVIKCSTNNISVEFLQPKSVMSQDVGKWLTENRNNFKKLISKTDSEIEQTKQAVFIRNAVVESGLSAIADDKAPKRLRNEFPNWDLDGFLPERIATLWEKQEYETIVKESFESEMFVDGFDYQKYMLKKFSKNDPTPAIAFGTLVHTTKGLVLAYDLNIGDELITSDNETTTIIDLIESEQAVFGINVMINADLSDDANEPKQFTKTIFLTEAIGISTFQYGDFEPIPCYEIESFSDIESLKNNVVFSMQSEVFQIDDTVEEIYNWGCTLNSANEPDLFIDFSERTPVKFDVHKIFEDCSGKGRTTEDVHTLFDEPHIDATKITHKSAEFLSKFDCMQNNCTGYSGINLKVKTIQIVTENNMPFFIEEDGIKVETLD